MARSRYRTGPRGVNVATWMTPEQRDRLRDFAAEHAVTVADLMRRGSDLAMREVVKEKEQVGAHV